MKNGLDKSKSLITDDVVRLSIYCNQFIIVVILLVYLFLYKVCGSRILQPFKLNQTSTFILLWRQI